MWKILTYAGVNKSTFFDTRLHIITNILCVVFVCFSLLFLAILFSNGISIPLVCHACTLILFLLVFVLNSYGKTMYARPLLVFFYPYLFFYLL